MQSSWAFSSHTAQQWLDSGYVRVGPQQVLKNNKKLPHHAQEYKVKVCDKKSNLILSTATVGRQYSGLCKKDGAL